MGRHSAGEAFRTALDQPPADVLGGYASFAAPPQQSRTGASPIPQLPPLGSDVYVIGLVLSIASAVALIAGTVQAITSSHAPAFIFAVMFGLALFLLIAHNTPAARLRRAAAAAEKEATQRAAQRAFLAQLERNYRMEVELGWRPETGYDVATEASRFSSAGAFNGLPRPAIWSYSDGLGGAPIRTPGGSVGVLNRRYGPLTPVQWAGVAAVAAWGLEHHHHRH